MTPPSGWPSRRVCAEPAHPPIACMRDGGDVAPRPGPDSARSSPIPFWRYLERMNQREAAPTTADVFARVNARAVIETYAAAETGRMERSEASRSAEAEKGPRPAHAAPRIGEVSEPERIERRVSIDQRSEQRVRTAVGAAIDIVM